MRVATCICGEHGSVNVQGDGFGQTFGRGAVVDLDAKVAPDKDLTWAEAIGPSSAHLFEVQPAEPRERGSKKRDVAAPAPITE